MIIPGRKQQKMNGVFLFPVKAMSIVYKTKFLQALQQMIEKGEIILPDNKDEKQLLSPLYHTDWINNPSDK
jgi:hypothetical protein